MAISDRLAVVRAELWFTALIRAPATNSPYEYG
jgi:hypothetical protein